ncbi:MAG TPA: cupin domain-containing protein [Gaiellaceae bacterium]|nr:cupin domain-containing protein [Gaiellaceae bacterium]
MTSVVNLFEVALEADEADPDGYRTSAARVGPLIGASALGLSAYGLPPGQSICPYHYEYPEEEWLVVLEGHPTLRDPAGEHELEPWDAVCFPVGPAGAHKVTNRTQEGVLVAMLSTKHATAVAIYPDSGKIGAWSGDGELKHLFRRADAVDYYDGEV